LTDCINFADGTNQWWALVEKGMNVFVPEKWEFFWSHGPLKKESSMKLCR